MDKELEKFEEYIASEREQIIKDLMSLKPRNKHEDTIINRAVTFIEQFT